MPSFHIFKSQGHAEVGPPHFKHHKPPRLLPLVMKRQLMCIWGRLIVTVFTGGSVRCSSDGVNLSGEAGDTIQLSTISAAHIHSRHLNTSTSTHAVAPSTTPTPKTTHTHLALIHNYLYWSLHTSIYFLLPLCSRQSHRFQQKRLLHHHIFVIRLQETQIITSDVTAERWSASDVAADVSFPIMVPPLSC